MSSGRGAGPAITRLGDRRLARLAAKGDPRAFAAIYERHHQDIFRYCRSITGNAEDAGDALQSTMAAAMRSLPGECREIALRPWLFRIAHNESVSIIRRRAAYVELTDAVAPTAPSSYSVASVRERLSGLIDDLGNLPERQRGALVMRELIGLEYGEIADALGISGGAARQAVYEARLALSQTSEGREMACSAARTSISARDGRMLRGRRLRAHLRGCSGCTRFSEQLAARQSALPALFPPLPAAAGTAILGGLVGGAATFGGGASVGALGGAGSGGVMSLITGGISQAAGASAAAKGTAAAVAVAVVAGVGTVEVTKEMKDPAQPRASARERAPGSGSAIAQAGLAPVRRASAPRSRRAARRLPPAAVPTPVPGAGDAPSAPKKPRRAPRRVKMPAPVSAPAPTPGVPAPTPAPAPVQAPAAAPIPAPAQGPWQQQYTQAMQQAQLGVQIGGRVYQQAMDLTQRIVSGIFPLARPR